MKIVFMGTPPAAAVSLQKLLDAGHEIIAVYTQPDRPSGRGNKIVFSAVKELAIDRGLPIFQPLKIKTSDALAEFKSHAADLAVVVAYGRILPEGFLNAFPNGAVNVHFSLLPKYRGAAPVNWAIVNGEHVTGVTTIKMDAGLDTGDMLIARETLIGENETAPELMSRLSAIGADVLLETLDTLSTITPVVQDHDAATFAPIMTRVHGRIDWNLKAGEISNRIRGFQPFPGSFTFLDGKRVVLWSARPATYADQQKAEAGEIVTISPDSLTVAAGEKTFLEIGELQFEGKRRVSVTEALKGGLLKIGGLFTGSEGA